MLRNKTTLFNEKINIVIANTKAVLNTFETFVKEAFDISEDQESNYHEKINRYLKAIVDTITSINSNTVPTVVAEMTDAMKEAKIEVDKSKDIFKNLSFQTLVSKSIQAKNEFEEVSKNSMLLISRLEEQLNEAIEIAKPHQNLQDASNITFFGSMSEKYDSKSENEVSRSLSLN